MVPASNAASMWAGAVDSLVFTRLRRRNAQRRRNGSAGPALYLAAVGFELFAISAVLTVSIMFSYSVSLRVVRFIRISRAWSANALNWM